MNHYAELLTDYFKSLTTKTEPPIVIPEYVDDSKFSPEQELAFESFKSGKNLLILGSAGTGKSKMIKTFYDYTKTVNPHKRIHLCATTGIASYNIKGVTIHSFMGLGMGNKPLNDLLRYMKKDTKVRIISADIIIIDEISMLSADLFEKIDAICKHVRKNLEPFGGIQVVVTGDLLQLLPVFKGLTDQRLIIQSPVFNENFTRENTIVFIENFRQKNDTGYIEILSRIRLGKHTEQDISALELRKKAVAPADTIVLVSSNKKAAEINKARLKLLPEPEFKYTAKYEMSDNSEEAAFLYRDLFSQFKTRETNDIVLKIGCRVMLVRNLDTELGLVNGATGNVLEIKKNGEIVILFDNKVKHTIKRVVWELESNGHSCTVTQIPLLLAYSITCHKSQSLTLNAAVLDLSDCFCDHMVYVALSRVKSIDGVFLKSFNPKKITVNKVSLDYLNKKDN